MIDYSENNGILRPDAGIVDKINCGICGEEMNVTRNIFGSRSFVGAMAGVKKHHDEFKCPHLDKEWHMQASKLKKEARRTFSETLADMFEKEAANIIRTKVATRKVSPFDL